MNRSLIIVALLAFWAAGCAHTRIIQSGELPVYGADPLLHTVYLGSDERFHHFALQHGKSGSEVVVRREEAQIKPEPFAAGSERWAFVESAGPGIIRIAAVPPSR